MLIAIPEDEWTIFNPSSPIELSDILLNLASKVDLAKFKKTKRGPKKPPPSKNQFKGKPHVSTAKLLAAAAAG